MLKNKKIYWCTDSPGFGGAEKSLFRVTGFLKEEFEVEFIVSNAISAEVREFLDKGEYNYTYHNTSNNIRKLFSGLLAARRLTKKRKGLFVIWCHHLDSNRWLQFWLALTRKEFIVVERLLPSHISELKKSRFVIPIKKFVVSRARKVILCGYSQQQNYQLFFKAKNCDVIPNSRPVIEIAEKVSRLRELKPLGTDFPGTVICCIGRLCGQKDQLTLVHAFARISKKYNSTLLLVGDGENELMLKKDVDKLALKNVHFTGFDAEPLKWLAISNIFVLPSLAEGLPGALIEAMSAGVPCIATDIPGNRELIIEGQTGLLVSVKNDEAIAGAIEEYINSQELTGKVIKNAFDHVIKNYSSEEEKNKWVELFKELQ